MRFLLNWLLTSIAVAVATALVPGIAPFGAVDAWVCFAGVGLFLGLTLGVFQLVVNSFMLELASWLSVNLLGAGISISGFFPALLGSVIISAVLALLGSVADAA